MKHSCGHGGKTKTYRSECAITYYDCIKDTSSKDDDVKYAVDLMKCDDEDDNDDDNDTIYPRQRSS